MSDNDLIRRGDALRIMSDGDDIVWPDYPEWFINRYATINAIPAAQPTVKPLGADGVTIHPQDILNAAWRDDLGEEGLAMYARILSALDVQPTVSPDVVALDEVYDTMMEVQRNPTGAWQAIQDQADTITTLRAQLAEAQRLMRLERTIADKNADRADRAEAALAAQIKKEEKG